MKPRIKNYPSHFSFYIRESAESTGYSPTELFLGRQLYRTSDWGNNQLPKESHVNPEAWLEIHQPEVDKKRNEAKLPSRKPRSSMLRKRKY